MGDFLFDKNRQFYFCKTDDFGYRIPETITKEDLDLTIEEFPDITVP